MKKQKRLIPVLTCLLVLLSAGIHVADAGYFADSAALQYYSSSNQSWQNYYTAAYADTKNSDYAYYAWTYADEAEYYSYYAALYAYNAYINGYSYDAYPFSYYAYYYSDLAYDYQDVAEDYIYYVWLYGASYLPTAAYYQVQAESYGALAAYYAGAAGIMTLN